MGELRKMSLHLSGLRFFGHYGCYPVESKWTTELIIDITLNFKIPVTGSINLEDTIDYTQIYEAINSEMKKDHLLIESIALILIQRLKNLDKRIETCKIKVLKKPQLGGAYDHVAVEMEY